MKLVSSSALFLGLMVGFLVLNAGLDIGSFAVATTTFDGLVVDHYYNHGLHYSQELKPLAESIGWKVQLKVPGPAGKASPVTVQLLDRAGVALRGAKVRLQLFRPTREGYDQMVALAEQSPGVFSATVSIPLQGIWEATVDIERGGKHYVHPERIRVRS